MNKVQKGIIFALFTALISGFSIFYNKIVVVSGIDSTIFNIIKNGGVGIIIGLILLTSGKIKNFSELSVSSLLKLVVIAIVGGAIPFVLFFEGLKLVPAVNATIIQKSMFLWVSLLALPLLKEKISPLQLVGFMLIAWSNLFIGGIKGFSFSHAEQLILIATLLWSVEIIITKVTLKNVDTNLVSFARMFGGALCLIIIAAVQGKLPLLTHVTNAQLIATTGSIAFLTGYVLSWHRALKYASATLVTSVLILATPITNILSAVFITHAFPTQIITNVVGSLVGVTFFAFLGHRTKHQTDSVIIHES